MSLRLLLIQRAARLQQRPALSAAPWSLIHYSGYRNRVEGVGFGLLAADLEVVHAATGTPWDWMAELAAAAAGLRWDEAGTPVPDSILGGDDFNSEEGRGRFHDREAFVLDDTPFTAHLTHGEFLRRLARLNQKLGWDHDTVARLPRSAWGTPEMRGALWSALYAGAHAVIVDESQNVKTTRRWFAPKPAPLEELAPFLELEL